VDPLSDADQQALYLIDLRVRILLPEQYQESYESVQPTPMRSAGLKFDADGRVAWDDIWQSFCDLALAGGPPHKGTLLAPGKQADIDAAPDRYEDVVAEICRGIIMASDLPAGASPRPGWVRVECYSETMADWLLRAITIENVAVSREERMSIDLPAAPHFTIDKEIKNVVTVIAKTSHYWTGHMTRAHKADVGGLFAQLSAESPLVAPDWTNDSPWRGIEMPSVPIAVWMTRALIASNVLARREGTMLIVPTEAASDEGVAQRIARLHRLAVVVAARRQRA
jgi:sirohydrochlorin cobaltochelatase